jgi:hypothetical protein
MALPTITEVGAITAGSTQACTPPALSAGTSGKLLVLVAGIRNALNPSFGQPAGWTQIVNAANSFGSARLVVFRRVGDGTSTDDGDFDWGGTPTNGWQAQRYILDGVDTSSPIDVSASAHQNSGANPTVPGVTTTGPDRLLLSWLFTTGADVTGDPSGWTLDDENEPSANSLYCYSRTAPTAGAYGGETITIASHAGVRITVAITPADEGSGIAADAVPVVVHARAVATTGTFGEVPGPVGQAIETLRPNSTVYNGDTPPWVGDPDATDLYENVNDSTPSDASVVYLPEGSAFFGSNLRLGLPAPVGTIRTGEDPSGHVVRVRIVSADDGVPIAPSGVPEWNLDLWQDSVAKAPRSSASAQLPDLTGAWQDVSYELTEAEAASISDYSLLRVSITARTQSTTYGVAVSSVSVDVPVLVAEDTPTAVPVSGHARAVAALGEFGGVTPTDGDAVPAATDVRAVPASGAFAGLAADGVPAQATGHSVAATGEFGALATTATPAAVRAQAAPSVGTSGALDAATSPVAVVARPLAASAGFDALDGDAAPAHVTAHALATTAALGVLAGDAVPAAAHVRSVPATASDITPITGDAAPAAGIVRSVAASGAFGPLPASAGPARVANRAVAASGLFGGLAGTTTPVSALAFAVPADAENDPLTIAGTAVPAAVTATASAGFGTFGELAGAMVPVQVSGLAVTATVVFGGLAALGVPVVVFATSKAAVLSFVDPDALRPMRATLTRAPWIEVRLTDAPAIGASLLRAPLLDAYRGDP